jgi:hypothetical protein
MTHSSILAHVPVIFQNEVKEKMSVSKTMVNLKKF